MLSPVIKGLDPSHRQRDFSVDVFFDALDEINGHLNSSQLEFLVRVVIFHFNFLFFFFQIFENLRELIAQILHDLLRSLVVARLHLCKGLSDLVNEMYSAVVSVDKAVTPVRDVVVLDLSDPVLVSDVVLVVECKIQHRLVLFF